MQEQPTGRVVPANTPTTARERGAVFPPAIAPGNDQEKGPLTHEKIRKGKAMAVSISAASYNPCTRVSLPMVGEGMITVSVQPKWLRVRRNA